MLTNPTGYFVSAYEENLFHGRYQDPMNGSELTWEDVFRRMIRVVAGSEHNNVARNEFFDETLDAMSSARIIASSPQMWNYGTSRRWNRNGSSCFVGRMGDSLKDFRGADSDAEDVYVASGGYGLLLDSVRPRGCKIKHCSEGAMGSMCFGGPARRIEGTTGYITGSGRARGALMLQLGLQHPDVLEFILSKRPRALSWLDDWPANARSSAPHLSSFVDGYSVRYVNSKDWPSVEEVVLELGRESVAAALASSVVRVDGGRLVPVFRGIRGVLVEPSRDWDLPLQNCNMSVRASDEFMYAVEDDLPWTFRWWSGEEGGATWTKTDMVDGRLSEYLTAFDVDERTSQVTPSSTRTSRYGVIIGTWEGMQQLLSPNSNQWRDTEYARFYRTVIQPTIGHLSGRITAQKLWEIVCENGWNHADPAVVFSGTYERYQPVDTAVYGPRLSNPCSEFVCSAGGSCNLISVNLRKAADDAGVTREVLVGGGRPMETGGDWLALRGTVAFTGYLWAIDSAARIATEYISRALEYNEAPIGFINEMTREHYRPIGVGIMGLAEALMKFHVRYGSRCAASFAAASTAAVTLAAWETSFDMAMRRQWKKPIAWLPGKMEEIFSLRASSGASYELSDDQVGRWARLAQRVADGEYGTHTVVGSVAPTGTISQVAAWQMSRAASAPVSVSSGCEPQFHWGVKRQDSSGRDETYHDLWFTEEHQHQPWMVTAMSGISPAEHIEMQAAVAAFTCMSVSKTINLPASATVEDVRRCLELAWKLGVPGTALYRDQSKPVQVLSALECPGGECRTVHAQLPESDSADPSVQPLFADASGLGLLRVDLAASSAAK